MSSFPTGIVLRRLILTPHQFSEPFDRPGFVRHDRQVKTRNIFENLNVRPDCHDLFRVLEHIEVGRFAAAPVAHPNRDYVVGVQVHYGPSEIATVQRVSD